MKELDDLIKKVGNDKVLHFLGGGWICAVITFVSILQEGDLDSWGKISCVIIGTTVVAFLSVVKEIIMDDKADWFDVLASIAGCVTIFAAVGIGILFNRHYKIFCVNGNTGFRNESRIFYFIHLQNEEDYERKESSSA